MHKKNMPAFVSVTVLTLLIVILLGANSIRRTAHIHLPDENTMQESESSEMDGSAVNQLSVTPDTVQQVIATLDRADGYARTVTVEQFWSGGSGVFTSSVFSLYGWTRTDTQMTDGSLRHSITDGEISYIWYGAEKSFYTGSAGEFGADVEQMIPTYEDVLALSPEQILKAGYRSYADTECIYVETQLPDGITLSHWVDVHSGLLTAAEKYEGETLVYRMTATAASDMLLEEQFVLPDGTSVLHG